MGENSGIQWTDHTFNPWIGCTKVSPGCDHCYAETWAKRYGTATWGSGEPRHLTSESNWQQPLKWNRQAEAEGKRLRVFCASLADVFDNEVPSEWRARLFDIIHSTPYLDWLLLTKRIGNVNKMLASWACIDKLWPNVWLGASIVNQEEANRDIPKLLATPAKVRFLSLEPLLGPVDLSGIPANLNPLPQHEAWDWFNALTGCGEFQGEYAGAPDYPKIDWVIVGGESGPGARPMSPHWVRDLRNQCINSGVPFFFKQWGEWGWWQGGYFGPGTRAMEKRFVGGDEAPFRAWMTRTGKKLAGRVLDGREWNEFPRAA